MSQGLARKTQGDSGLPVKAVAEFQGGPLGQAEEKQRHPAAQQVEVLEAPEVLKGKDIAAAIQLAQADLAEILLPMNQDKIQQREDTQALVPTSCRITAGVRILL